MANSLIRLRVLTGLTGLGLGVLVVGWPGGDGALVNLDLLAIGDLDAPRSLVALGPEIPRQAPIQALLAAISPPLSAVEVTRLWMIAIVALAFTGMTLHLRCARIAVRGGAGVAYALSPFLLTRLAVGHLGFATAVALAPFALSALQRPLDDTRRTFLWLCAFATCGYFGALVAGPMVAIGVIAQRARPTAGQVSSAVLSQTPWLLPALVSIGDASGAAGSSQFETTVSSGADLARLVIGFGFWRDANQLGWENAWTLLVALLVLLFAGIGVRWGVQRQKLQLVALGALGLAVSLASVVPGVRTVYDRLTEVALFAPLREGQRLLGFTVLAAIVLAARGLDALLDGARRPAVWATGAALGATMLTVTGGALWGLDGATDAHAVPDSWYEAAAIVETEPGLTLALPWSQYFDVSIADGRRGHHPLPRFLGGEVIFRHDLGLGASGRISRDDREDDVRVLLRALRLGEPVDNRIRELGLAWVVALPETPLGRDDIDRLRGVATLDVVHDTPDVVVFRGPGGATRTLSDWDAAATVVLIADLAWLAIALTVVGRPRDENPGVRSGRGCD